MENDVRNNVRHCSKPHAMTTLLKRRMSEGLQAERAPSDPRPRARHCFPLVMTFSALISFIIFDVKIMSK